MARPRYSRALALAAAVAVGMSVAWGPSDLPDVTLCFLKRLTGIACPACGLTRSFCSISHAQFAVAWHYNPFGYLFYAFAVALLLRPAFLKLCPSVESRILESGGAKIFPLSLICLMWAFGLLRALGLFPSAS